MVKFSDYSFGATSAVMTSLAIIVGLSNIPNHRISIITALLVIAIADNISDSFGIHIQQEAQHLSPKEVARITNSNFITRLFVVFVYILFIYFLPINIALIFSIIIGILIITLLSYFIALDKKENPYKAVFQHLGIAFAVMMSSYFLRELITKIPSLF
jgi:vacuolar iron transporter family protein